MHATVLIPTHEHRPSLVRAIESVLAQTIADIEIFVVGDGVSDATRELVAGLRWRDRRIRFFDNPKGPRRGEIHRHAALAEARGEIVCYLSDDDLYFPNHVETMCELLRGADFANALPVCILPGDVIVPYAVDLSLPTERKMLIAGTKGVTALSCGAHALAMYRRLPYGWRTTPDGMATDAYMWHQFMSDPRCRAVTGTRPTMLNFPSALRTDWTLDERTAETERWYARVADPLERERLIQEIYDSVVRERAAQVARYQRLTMHPLMWVANRIKAIPIAGPAFWSIARAAKRRLAKGAVSKAERANQKAESRRRK